MAAHVLISYTPVFSYCCCRLGLFLIFFYSYDMRFLALYQSLLLNLHRGALGDNKSKSNLAW